MKTFVIKVKVDVADDIKKEDLIVGGNGNGISITNPQDRGIHLKESEITSTEEKMEVDDVEEMKKELEHTSLEDMQLMKTLIDQEVERRGLKNTGG